MRNSPLDQNEDNSEEEATSVDRRRRLVLAAVLVAAAIGFSIGKIATAPAAEASAAHRYTLRVGDKVTIPAINQRCAVYTEGGAL